MATQSTGLNALPLGANITVSKLWPARPPERELGANATTLVNVNTTLVNVNTTVAMPALWT